MFKEFKEFAMKEAIAILEGFDIQIEVDIVSV